MRLKGKIALITAAGQGIGKATALALAAEGAQVWATDINAELLKIYEGVAGIQTAVLNVLDKSAITALVATLPALDVLFNCAGFVHKGAILEANLNARAQFWMIQAVLPRMLDKAKTSSGASIINMASVCSSMKGLPSRFLYGASKAAVIGLTKSVAADFVAQGVRCNAICPGTVDTPSLQDRINAFDDPVQARQNFIDRQPMGRLAQAHEIAPLVVFLASDESAFVTGQAYAIDGGMSI
jgi:2-keto-3-deoxy-L-fuconate dehydrogenase